MSDDLEKKQGDGKFWYALYTKPRHEFKAAEQIQKIGVDHYLPVVTSLKQWSDRKKTISEPVLRGYIFILADERERTLSLEQSAVVRCLFDQGRPAKIPGWQIDNLKRFLKSDSEFYIQNGLFPGVKVKIKQGPFEGIIGTIVESSNGRNIAVSIDILNRSVLTLLPQESSVEIIKDNI